MNIEAINKWLDEEYGCSYTKLEELHDFYFEKYCDLKKENKELKKQLEYLRSGEYYNQLRFERDMLQYVVDNGKVSKEDKDFIDMTHRNTELLEVIEEVREYMKKNRTRYIYQDNLGEDWWFEDLDVYSELLQILDKVKN